MNSIDYLLIAGIGIASYAGGGLFWMGASFAAIATLFAAGEALGVDK